MITIRKSAMAAAMLLAGACQPKDSGPAKIEEFSVAGIRVIHKMVTENDVIAARLFIDGGSAAETSQTAGIESLYLAAMTRGTEKYDRDAFAAASTASGTTIGYEVSRPFSNATMLAVREHLDESWDLFTQAVMHPTLPQNELDLVRDQLVFGLKQRVDDPDSHLAMTVDSVFFAGHPYAVDPQGTPVTMASFKRNDLIEWQKNRLTKANLLLVVVGNVSRADLESRISSTFGTLPEGDTTRISVAPAPSVPATLTVIPQPLPTNYIQGAFAVPARNEVDYPVMALGIRILQERLFEEVRTKRNLSYAPSIFQSVNRVGQGSIYVTAVDPDTTIKVMLGELRRMQTDPVGAEEIQEALSKYVTFYWLNQETNMGQAFQLGLWELSGGGWENVLAFPDKLKAVTAEDLQRVAKLYFRNIQFVVIGKVGDKSVYTGM